MQPASARAADLAFAAACAAIPLAFFLVLFHWQVLLLTNIAWLMQGDWGANLVGWNAFRHDDWRWPLGATRLLAWPTGVTVTLTDSNPLLSLLFKPFGPLLPERFQFFGLWYLACVVLQFAIGYQLVRGMSENRWARLAGAALLLVVPVFANRIGHASLFGHWTILAALYVFICVRSEVRRSLAFAGVLALSALIHPYLLLMNAGIWGADVLRQLFGAARGGSPVRPALAISVISAPLLVLWSVGAFRSGTATAGGFGHYSMSLDALFNPGREEYSRLFGFRPQGPGQVFEGFQYLGAGLILLALAAAAAAAVSPQARARVRGMTWLPWLAPTLSVLFVLALSDTVQLHGRPVARLPYDWAPVELTDAFRATGRLVWPFAYVLVLASLKVVLGFRPALALAIAAGAFAIQLFDLSGLLLSARALTAEAVRPEPFRRTPSPQWDALIRSADRVEVQPPNPREDERLFYETAWRATSLRRPVNVMYAARENRAQQAFEVRSRRAFTAGEVDPRRLYVLADGCLAPGLAASRTRILDGTLVIPPAAATVALPPAPEAQTIALGETVSFTPGQPKGRCALGADWSDPEGWGVWSDGAEPELLIRLAAAPERDLLLTFTAHAFPPTGQPVSVEAGGRAVGGVMLAGDAATYQLRIPKEAAAGPLLRLVLRVARPTSPRFLVRTGDERRLGVGLESIRLDPAG